jgi:hypothetical protein
MRSRFIALDHTGPAGGVRCERGAADAREEAGRHRGADKSAAGLRIRSKPGHENMFASSITGQAGLAGSSPTRALISSGIAMRSFRTAVAG